jgi:hypothetical protein
MESASALAETLAPGETLSLSDLPTVKVPTAGALNWQLPDGGAAKTIDGVIVARQPVRAYWATSFDEGGGGAPPDCSSTDLLTGIGDNGTPEAGPHACATCPMAQFGSATNARGEQTQGQACRQITRLFVLQEGSMLPTLVALPPSSYAAAKRYAVRQPLHSVETSISLTNAKSGGGINYSEATFAVNRVLEPEERAAMTAYREAILPFVRQAPVAAPPAIGHVPPPDFLAQVGTDDEEEPEY